MVFWCPILLPGVSIEGLEEGEENEDICVFESARVSKDQQEARTIFAWSQLLHLNPHINQPPKATQGNTTRLHQPLCTKIDKVGCLIMQAAIS